MDAWTHEHLGHELGIPVKQEMDEITLDLVGRTKTQLLWRFVTPANVNRFQLVGTNKFICVKDMPNSGAPVGNKEACENFELEVVGEKNGVDLFHLRTAADHKYLALTRTQSTGPNGWKFRSETNKDNASTFFLVDEQIEFFVVQLFKSPFNTLNNENEVAPFVAGKRNPNICKQPLNVPIWMRIPLNYSMSGTIDGTEQQIWTMLASMDTLQHKVQMCQPNVQHFSIWFTTQTMELLLCASSTSIAKLDGFVSDRFLAMLCEKKR